MSKKAKQEYLKEIRKRYLWASKGEKNSILNEFCTVCGYNRKYAIRLIRNNDLPGNLNKRCGRKKQYHQAAIISFLEKLWIALNLACSRRLKAAIPVWINYSPVVLTREQKELLFKISFSTIDRLLKKKRRYFGKIGLATTKPGSLLRKQIPIATNQWDEKRPGFIEADTVAHCDNNIAGQYVHTVQVVDIATGWCESRGVWGKGEQGVFKALLSIEEALPFRIRGFDSDNGNEFLNRNLLKYFLNKKPQVQFTRSRPYKKNDNAHIEEKNWSNTRQHLGYQRFDKQEILLLLNDLYENEWSDLLNYFVPSMKLIKKERQGSKMIKVHDAPQTPFVRLCGCPEIKKKQKSEMMIKLNSINPFELQERFKKKILVILNLAAKTI